FPYTTLFRSCEPGGEIFADEIVVGEFRVGVVDAVDFGGLAGRELFVRVEAPGAGHEALFRENAMDAGDAAGEAVGDIEEGGVVIGERDVPGHPVDGDFGVLAGFFDFFEHGDGFSGADAPLAEEAAGDPAFFGRSGGEGEGGEEIGDDVVVVSGVESDVVASGFEGGADDVDAVVAVERSDLDGNDVGDFD